MAQNEQLLQETGELYPRGSTTGISSSGAGVGLSQSPPPGGVVNLPPINIIPQTATQTQAGANGWIEVDYEWENPTAFAGLAATKYTFFEGVIPTGYRFILRHIESEIPFDTSSVGAYDLLSVLPARAHSSADSYLVLSLNGASVSQGLNNLDSAGVGATFNYAPTVFDLLAGVSVYRVFDENTTFAIYSYVTFANNNAYATNSLGVKTRISGVLIPKGI